MSINRLIALIPGILILSILNSCTEKEPENTAPIAVFTAGSNTGTIETLFTFDASACSDLEDSTENLMVRWDWENNGSWDTDFTTEKIIKKCFGKVGFYKVTIEVKDTEGLSTKYSEIINIEDYFLLDSRDQKQYRTVKIGTQLWMAENLNFVTVQGSYCHDNDDDICLTYGRLYEWETTTYACPNGWRLPEIEDWNLLIAFLGENESAQLRSDHGWLAESHGTNSSGFNALPASYLTEYGEFMALGGYAFFWTATENDENTAWNIMLSYNTEVAEKNFYNKNNALSVRCLKN
jgi:uncharacterized protein (TIGR02145 family)